MKLSREVGENVVSYMKPLPLVFSDQPYLPGQRRGPSSQTSLFKKAKKKARQKRLPLHLASTCTRPQSLNITEFPSLPEKVPSKDLPTKETPPKRPPTDPSESFPPPTDLSEISKDPRECSEVF